MKIAAPAETPLVNEVKLMLEQLPFDGAQVLELGCGKAEKTRLLAETGRVGGILALEVDTIQHERNLQIADLPQVQFRHAGAEAIPADDNSIDIVLMFKSLQDRKSTRLNSSQTCALPILDQSGCCILPFWQNTTT